MAGHANTIEDTLKHLKQENDAVYFIETGTFKGDTTNIAKDIFKNVYSIEIRENLYEKAKERFNAFGNVTLLYGDSSVVLENIKSEIKNNAIFFLDAHWAGDLSSKGKSDSPLLEELNILRERVDIYKDIIVIDDIGWVGKKNKIIFKPEWKSKYFPKGGIFKYDWTHINLKEIKNLFENARFIEKDDRLIIYT